MLSRFPNRRKSELLIRGGLFTQSELAAFNARYLASTISSGFGHLLTFTNGSYLELEIC